MNSAKALSWEGKTILLMVNVDSFPGQAQIKVLIERKGNSFSLFGQ